MSRATFTNRALLALLASFVFALALGESPEQTKVRVTTWNLEWFPNGSAHDATPEVQAQRIAAAALGESDTMTCRTPKASRNKVRHRQFRTQCFWSAGVLRRFLPTITARKLRRHRLAPVGLRSLLRSLLDHPYPKTRR